MGFGCALAGLFGQSAPPAERVTIIMAPSGCIPQTVTIKGPKVSLYVENATGLRAPSFKVDRGERISGTSTATIQEKGLAKEIREWRQDLDLTPGAYTLSIAGRNEWTCRIQVTGGGK